MGSIVVLTESDLRGAVGFGKEEFAAVEAVYPLISAGVASMPPIMRIDVPEHRGEIDVKSAYLPGYAGIAVKVSAGFFDNPARGLPSLGGLMMVFDAQTGVPLAALFDNGYLTDLRTGLAGAVAAAHLAVPDATVLAVVGAGTQARVQVEAAMMVRPITSVRVWARRPDQARELAAEIGVRWGIRAETFGTAAEAIADAHIVVTTTPSTEPLVTESMLHPGLHLTSVGSDAESKQELAPDLLARADLVACDSLPQSLRLGELRGAREAGVDVSGVVELGRVIEDPAVGRTSPTEMTVCDLTGTGAQDTAIASLAVRRCAELSLGTTLRT